MGVCKPKAGTVLSDDDGEAVAIVVMRGAAIEEIRAQWRAVVGQALGYPTFATWHLHSAQQMRVEGHDHEQFWSPAGQCRTSIDVAIPNGGV